jgi:hypothetical protein
MFVLQYILIASAADLFKLGDVPPQAQSIAQLR